jgi:hypothetical protein
MRNRVINTRYAVEIFLRTLLKMKNPFIYKREKEKGGKIKKEMKKNRELSNISKC